MDIQFGVSTWVWTSPFNTGSTQLFPKIKQMGFDVVEIPVEDPSVIDGQKVKEALDEHGLKAVVCGAFGPGRDLTHEDPAVHKQCLDYLHTLMEFCKTWDTNIVAGPMYSAVGKARMVPPDQRKREWEMAVNNITKACKMASEMGLELAIEPLNRFETDLINTTAQVKQLVEDINHPSAKILLDSFHMTIEEQDLEQAFRTAGDDLVHVQASENFRGTPGTGLTNWESFRKGLEAVNYNGVVSIESFTSDNQELADAVCIWRPLANDQDKLAQDGLNFLATTLK